jgi:type II secretory pathway pseudopilin PulG
MRLKRPSGQTQTGFTLVAVLAAMFLLALATQQVMQVVSQQAQREREADLLRIGTAYAQAIGTYYESSPGTVKEWPTSLQDLVNDRRFVTLRRHLREVYADPITRSVQWGTVPALGGGIAGVYSLSEAKPIRSGGIDVQDLGLPAASRYSDWKFIYTPILMAGGASP